MLAPPTLNLPLDRSERAHCGHRSRTDKLCNRRPGHTGRHAFYWRHLDGRVREVWG